jgi:hypothetical protein
MKGMAYPMEAIAKSHLTCGWGEWTQ